MLGFPKSIEKLRDRIAPDDENASPENRVVRLPEGKPLANQPGKGFNWRPGAIANVASGKLLRISFALCVVLPTVLASVYYIFIAADQYAVQAQFAVRSKETSGASFDGLTILSGITGSSSNSSDSYVLINFIGSRDLVGKIDEDLDLRKLFSRSEADFLAKVDDEAPIEDLVDYWREKVLVVYDTYSGIIRLEVRAFRPDDAVKVAQKIIGYSEQLVNDLSRRARNDAVADSESEVARAENRLRLARRAMANFRGSELRLNPVATAESRERIIAGLEGELSKQQTELEFLDKISPNSPRITAIQSQIGAIKKQIASTRLRTNRNDSSDEGTLNQQLSQYEELQTEREFAEKAYVSSLASLEKARIEASSQSRYLSVFVEPRLPDIALYPEGLRNVIVILIGGLLLWAIGTLIVASVRDHVN